TVRALHCNRHMSRAYPILSLSLSLLVAACGDSRSAASESRPVAKDSAAGDVKLATRDTARDSLRTDTAAASTSDTAHAKNKKAMPDSAIMIQPATQPKLRTKADSISLVASIRTGLKNPGWPVKTPPLLAGSILPAKRIVAFYGNPLSKKM